MTNKDLILASLMRAMIKYDGGDAPRIQHFVKVHDFARMIAIAEGMNQEDLFVLEADFLVNSFEAHLAPEGIITFRDHVFRSESAISMLNDMWGLE